MDNSGKVYSLSPDTRERSVTGTLPFLRSSPFPLLPPSSFLLPPSSFLLHPHSTSSRAWEAAACAGDFTRSEVEARELHPRVKTLTWDTCQLLFPQRNFRAASLKGLKPKPCLQSKTGEAWMYHLKVKLGYYSPQSVGTKRGSLAHCRPQNSYRMSLLLENLLRRQNEWRRVTGKVLNLSQRRSQALHAPHQPLEDFSQQLTYLWVSSEDQDNV